MEFALERGFQVKKLSIDRSLEPSREIADMISAAPDIIVILKEWLSHFHTTFLENFILKYKYNSDEISFVCGGL